MKKKVTKTLIEVYDRKDGNVIRFIKVEDLPQKIKKLISDAELLSVFYQDGEIIAEDKHGAEYNISEHL